MHVGSICMLDFVCMLEFVCMLDLVCMLCLACMLGLICMLHPMWDLMYMPSPYLLTCCAERQEG